MKQAKTSTPRNVLLTNGRFPTTLDLARQLKLAGHRVFVVDCMHFHVCRFSNTVKRSYRVPVPREDPSGFISGVKHAISDAQIDLVIPVHEEILYLAKASDTDEDLRTKLLAPDFKTLVRLHNKWEFWRFLKSRHLDVPKAQLCRTYNDILQLDRDTEWAVKPVYGRASTSIFHLHPGDKRVQPPENEVDVGAGKHYIAQEWIHGSRYCSYGVALRGRLVAFALYPVKDTIDGSSCVYFQSIEHPRIRTYIDRILAGLPNFTGQVAFDFIESTTAPHRLVAIECNPRATAGIHLFSGTPTLAHAMTSSNLPPHSPSDAITSNIQRSPTATAQPGAHRQLAPGMLMWRRNKGDYAKTGALREYVRHMKRLTTSRDVIFSKRDLMPSLMQPFLLTSYYAICREKKLKLPEMFQWDLTWEVDGEELEGVRRMFEEDGEDPMRRGSVGMGSEAPLLPQQGFQLRVLLFTNGVGRRDCYRPILEVEGQEARKRSTWRSHPTYVDTCLSRANRTVHLTPP
ncbi:hypothetical protein FPV67DRAFT_1609801 [Lyophyllum atratum]|nr:hypothetical protein FPV67DRAFT_1609801 [Lyophyllum atratum]